jgi:uncharacterized protein (TIGR02466 family)
MEKILLWPTLLYYFKTENIDNDKIKKIILEKERTEPTKKISNIGGWQSHENLLTENNFYEIYNFLYDCTSHILKDIFIDSVNFYMINSWTNVNRKGNYNERHIHSHSHWSCVYYVTETYSAPIYFVDPRIRSEMMHDKKYLNKEGVSLFSSGIFFDGSPGEVFIFPSWLEHAVSQNTTDNPRISISCNFTTERQNGNISRKS